MKYVNSPKVLLLNPPVLDQSKYGKKLLRSQSPGTGLSYLYSYLKYNKYNCKIYDFSCDNWIYVKKILLYEEADIVGITCLTEGRYNAFKLLNLIRKIRKNTIIIFGGHHPTYMYNQILENFDIDYIILGEGEEKLLNLIRAIERKIPIETVEGIAYKINGKVIKNTSMKKYYIKDLDSLPFPFSEDQMWIFKKYNSKIKISPQSNFKRFPESNGNNGRIMITTSRGCPFNCQFCSSTLFWGNKWRFRSPKNVVDEVESYYRKLGFRNFKFTDDAFNIIPQRAIDICKEIFNRNLKIKFSITTRADKVTEELVLWLKKAGCTYASFGVESGSEKVRKIINKNLSLNSIIKAFNLYKKYKIPSTLFLMVGNPGETNETIIKTVALLRLIKPLKFEISLAMVFPGTQLYELAKKQGFVNDKFWLTNRPPPFYTFENSLRTLKKWAFQINNYDKRYLKQICMLFSLFSAIYYSEKIPFSLKKFLRYSYKKILFLKLLRPIIRKLNIF